MPKIVVLWTKPNDPEAFDERYRSGHMPLIAEYEGLRSQEALRVSANAPGSDLPYHVVWTGDVDDIRAYFASEVGQRVVADAQELAREFGNRFEGLFADDL